MYLNLFVTILDDNKDIILVSMNNFSSKILSLMVEMTPQLLVKRYIGNPVPIFMLHRLSSSSKEKSKKYQSHVKWCLNYIRKHKYNPISLDHLVKSIITGSPINSKSVVFTIDDGFYDQYETGSPLFSEFDIPLTCFVITDFLDGKLWPWDDQITYIINNTKLNSFMLILPEGKPFSYTLTPQNRPQKITELRNTLKKLDQTDLYTWIEYFYNTAEVLRPSTIPEKFQSMSWGDAQQFINSGHSIAPHTKTHRILSQLSEREAKEEIEGSCSRVETELKGSSKLFAYPTGRTEDYLNRDISILKNSGISCSVVTEPDYYSNKSGLYSIPRFGLPETRFHFIQYLSFFEALKNRIRD